MLGQGGRLQRAELDGGHGRQALQLRQDRAEGMAPVQVIGAVGADDRHPLGAQDPAEEREQVTGGRVRPVQVLEHQQDRGRGGQLGQQSQHRAEHLLPGHAGLIAAGRSGGPALRQQPAEQRTGGKGIPQLRRPGWLAGRCAV